MIPNYDKEQVYSSDIKKVFQWYNILHETNNLIQEESNEEPDENADHEKTESKKD